MNTGMDIGMDMETGMNRDTGMDADMGTGMDAGMDTGMSRDTDKDTGMDADMDTATATSMAAGGQPGLWEQVCAEYEAEQPQVPDVPESKRASEVSLEAGMLQPAHMEPLHSAPAADPVVQQLLPCPEPPDPKTCSPQEYLEHYVFPVLLPGLAELLHQAEKEKCFERKRTKFIACDFLTEWLYNKNPKRKDESFTEFFSIPFVSDWLKDHPRPPIPLSLLLSEEEASLIIQSFWRGYRESGRKPECDEVESLNSNHRVNSVPNHVRCDSEIQELRQWQKQLREERNIIKRVKEFWAKQEAKVGSKLEDSEEQEENH